MKMAACLFPLCKIVYSRFFSIPSVSSGTLMTMRGNVASARQNKEPSLRFLISLTSQLSLYSCIFLPYRVTISEAIILPLKDAKVCVWVDCYSYRLIRGVPDFLSFRCVHPCTACYPRYGTRSTPLSNPRTSQ